MQDFFTHLSENSLSLDGEVTNIAYETVTLSYEKDLSTILETDWVENWKHTQPDY